MYKAYKSWCDSEGERPLNQTNFGRRLTERGYVKKKKPHITYQGLRLVNPPILGKDDHSRLKEMLRRSKEHSDPAMM